MFDCYFLEMMYIQLMKSFHLADSNKLMTVTLISRIRISVVKIFHEHDVHHVWKLRIKRFRS